jgi:tetratricopeptide (TPR) repeat protein
MDNFNYMVNAEKPDFALRAELYSNRGEVFKLMGKPGEAAKDFNHALSINPKLLKPYLQIADMHVAGKSTTRALEIVTEGLRHIPDSKALQRRYLELGGKKPFPEPIVTKVPEPVTSQTADVAPITERVVEPVPDLATPPVSESNIEAEPQPPIGTPNNPYCRFCPPE